MTNQYNTKGKIPAIVAYGWDYANNTFGEKVIDSNDVGPRWETLESKLGKASPKLMK